jgi:hypothetical protein
MKYGNVGSENGCFMTANICESMALRLNARVLL